MTAGPDSKGHAREGRSPDGERPFWAGSGSGDAVELFFDGLSRAGERWNTRVVFAIGAGTLGFGGLRKQLPGITPRMLTRSLRSLERDGIISRTAHGDRIIYVDYSLTTLGLSALDALRTIMVWAVEHSTEVAIARKAFEDRL